MGWWRSRTTDGSRPDDDRTARTPSGRRIVAAEDQDRIVTAPVPDGPAGLAHGLACGAHRQVLNGCPWNAFGLDRAEETSVRAMLAEDWGVTTPEQWTWMLERLADPWPSQGDDVFAVRRGLAVEHGVVGVADWVAEIEADAGEDGDEIGALVAEARRVDAYEGLLRDRGLLWAGEQVPSLAAWDWARGVNMARDGLAAGLCDEEAARREVFRFGGLIRDHYTSWTEFGVAFTLGRLLWSYDRYDELVGWGHSVDLDRTVGIHHMLTNDPASPWHRLPFRREPGVPA